MAEMRTQRYVCDEFKKMMNVSGGVVKAPEIYHAFECEGRTYIVMEYVDGKTVGARLHGSSAEVKIRIYDQVAEAVKPLLHMPVSSVSRPGPVGGGCIQHRFSRGNVAPEEYDSIADLQGHINKVLALGRCKHEVDFSDEELCLCYTDSTAGNFVITEAGQLYVIDFEHAVFLPISFMGYILHESTRILTRKTSDMVSLPQSANFDAMGMASYFLKTSSNPQMDADSARL